MFRKVLYLKSTLNEALGGRGLDWGLHAFIFITIVCMFAPFSPGMPGESLDPSWHFGLSQAIAQGMAFGRDIMFTFGPYAPVFIRDFHPETYHLMIFGSLYLGVSYSIALFFVTRNSRWSLLMVLWVALVGFIDYRELLFSYPLLVSICFFKSMSRLPLPVPNEKLSILLISVLMFPFGLLLLAKSSFLILFLGILTLAAFFFALKKDCGRAIVVCTVPLFSLVFFWVVSGQSIFDLPSYFISMTQIISGYTEAMMKNGNLLEIITYMIAATLLLRTCLCTDGSRKKPHLFLFLVFFIYLFWAFKAGFVRHDGHATTAGTALFLASLFMRFTFRTRQTLFVLCISFFVWMIIYSHYEKISTMAVFNHIKSTYSSVWQGIEMRSTEGNRLEQNFNKALKDLRDKAQFPVLKGTTDIYSYNQSYLIASGNHWDPRPVLQSYSAYTPSLAEINKQHLLGEKAPDNIIFRVEPIDGRLPSIEDGASWPVLLTRYQPTALKNNFIYLTKNRGQATAQNTLPLDSGSYFFGDEVTVPNGSMPIFAEINIKQNLLGEIVNILYKPSQLQIKVTLQDGSIKTFRLVSGMIASGFLISPCIENTLDFSLLYGSMNSLSKKRVKSFSIAPAYGKWQWERKYNVSFKEIVTPNIDFAKKLVKGAVE